MFVLYGTEISIVRKRKRDGFRTMVKAQSALLQGNDAMDTWDVYKNFHIQSKRNWERSLLRLQMLT